MKNYSIRQKQLAAIPFQKLVVFCITNLRKPLLRTVLQFVQTSGSIINKCNTISHWTLVRLQNISVTSTQPFQSFSTFLFPFFLFPFILWCLVWNVLIKYKGTEFQFCIICLCFLTLDWLSFYLEKISLKKRFLFKKMSKSFSIIALA